MRRTVAIISLAVMALGLGFGIRAATALSLLALVGCGLSLIAAKVRKRTEEDKTGGPTMQMIPISESGDPGYFCSVAGVGYRNTAEDVGGFLGYVRSEPENRYDRNAIAVYRNDGKLLGYIPKNDQKTFREWSARDNLPCVGFIKEGDGVPLFGKVKVIDGDTDETEFEVARFVRWMIDNLGVGFIPDGFELHTDKPLQTKQDWMDALGDYLENKGDELYEDA